VIHARDWGGGGGGEESSHIQLECYLSVLAEKRGQFSVFCFSRRNTETTLHLTVQRTQQGHPKIKNTRSFSYLIIERLSMTLTTDGKRRR